MRSYVSDPLTDRIIYGAIRVHQRLGPGFVEVVYRRALVVELGKVGLACDTEKEILIYYDGVQVGRHVLDLLVGGKVIVETKAVDALNKVYYAQVRAYLKATGLSVALLVNFGDARADFRRIVLP